MDLDQIDTVIAEVNGLTSRHLWLDFEVRSYRDGVLEVSGTGGWEWWSDLQVVFDDVCWASVRFQGWKNLMPNDQDPVHFAVCVADGGSEDLTVGMLYRVLSDAEAATEELVRVVDDSGEDYLYPAMRFVTVEVPAAEIPRLLAAATPGS